jgi:hypothetical protein
VVGEFPLQVGPGLHGATVALATRESPVMVSDIYSILPSIFTSYHSVILRAGAKISTADEWRAGRVWRAERGNGWRRVRDEYATGGIGLQSCIYTCRHLVYCYVCDR